MNKLTLTPFLTFNGQSEQAMNFYCKCLPDCKITRLERYGKSHPMSKSSEDSNRVLHGSIEFCGQTIIFLDMTEEHKVPQNENWSKSLLLNCESEAQFDLIFDGLKQGGQVMMGPESVGDIRKCAWVVDKFGVVWQPVLA